MSVRMLVRNFGIGFGFGILLCFGLVSQASTLRLESDLVIHPEQIKKYFGLVGQKIRSRESVSWPEASFSKPYQMKLQDVRVMGPFDIHFETFPQEIEFDLVWSNPKLSVGQFSVHDVVKKEVGGIPVRVHLDAECSGLSLNIVNGIYHAHGKAKWEYSGGRLNVKWQSFSLNIDQAGTFQLDLGQCQAPQGLSDKLQEVFLHSLRDRQWLESVLKDATAEELQDNLDDLQKELLSPRESGFFGSTALVWQPKEILDLGQGRLRIAGNLVVKTGANSNLAETVVPRGIDAETVMSKMTSSGLVLPRETLTAVMDHLYRNDEIKYRIDSSEVSQLNSFMKNRFLQFFIWPDLMSFHSTTKFYFDLGMSSAPIVGLGQRVQGGGSVFDIQAPVRVNQWAPYKSNYVPYADLNSNVSGKVYVSVKKGKLALVTRLSEPKLNLKFRPEFLKLRRINSWVATPVLSSELKRYLESKKLKFSVPKLSAGDGVDLVLQDVLATTQAVVLPFGFDLNQNK